MVGIYCDICTVTGYPCFVLEARGGSRCFSRGGGFSKKLRNVIDLFLRSTKLIFWALTNHFKEIIWTKLSAPHFSEYFDLKIAVFWRALPTQN